MVVRRERYGDANIRIVYTFGNGPLIMITDRNVLEFKRSLRYVFIYICLLPVCCLRYIYTYTSYIARDICCFLISVQPTDIQVGIGECTQQSYQNRYRRRNFYIIESSISQLKCWHFDIHYYREVLYIQQIYYIMLHKAETRQECIGKCLRSYKIVNETIVYSHALVYVCVRACVFRIMVSSGHVFIDTRHECGRSMQEARQIDLAYLHSVYA